MPFSMPLGIVVLPFNLTFSPGGRDTAGCKCRALLDLRGVSGLDLIAASDAKLQPEKTSVRDIDDFSSNLRAFSH